MDNIIIYSNGCSHTEVPDTEYQSSYTDIVFQEVFKTTDYIIKPISSGVINSDSKDEIEIPNENVIFRQARFGKSNDLIFFETINFINYIYSIGKKIDLITLQWSGPNRRFHTDHNGTIFNVNPHDFSELGIKFEPIATEHTIHFMKLFQDICKLYKIKYICIPYMEVDNKVFKKNLYKDTLDFSNYTTSIIKGHRNDFRKKRLVVDLQGHPSAKGIYEIGKTICNKFNINSIKNIEHYFSKKDLVRTLLKEKDKQVLKTHFTELGDATDSELIKLFNNLTKKLF